MYATLYGQDNIAHIPLRYVEYHEVKALETVFISAKSRSTRSSTIIAVWPSPSGILTSRAPSVDDVRVGKILVHNPVIKQEGTTTEFPHILAEIEWSQDHHQKFHFGNETIIAAPVIEPFSSASFMPISCILSRCAVVDKKIQMDYGEDSIRVAIPVQKCSILFH